MLRTLLSSALLLVPASALAWPTTAQWEPLTQGGSVLTDGAEDQAVSAGENAWDIVGNGANPAVHWYLDEDYLYFHILVNADPSSSAYAGSWGVLLETDGAGNNFEHSAYLSSYGQVLVVQENTDGGNGPSDGAETNVLTITSPMTSGNVIVDPLGGSIFGSSHDAHIDLALPLTDLYTNAVIDANTIFQVCAASSNSSLTESLNSDTAGPNNSAGIGSLPACLADPIHVDGDFDGLTWFVETDEYGTDPNLADSDYDTLDDGDEVDMQDMAGCPDPMDEDSDGDGLLDGEEVYTHGSDPCQVDSDGDGLSDYDEVMEHDTDPGEIDSDGDGISDYDEVSCAHAASGDPDDRDGDGISDATESNPEWEQDWDDDGQPNWCDTDSDGDDLPDQLEYGEDLDCDDENDWLDDYDDELCESGEPDTDTDADTDSDTDADTDADAVCDSGEAYCGGKLTGGGCSSAAGALLLLPALLAGLILGLRRSRRGASLAAGLLGLALLAPEAQAQGLDAQRFDPSIDGDRLLVLDDAVLAPEGGAQPGGGLMFNYAVRPVVYRLDDGSEQSVVDGLGTLDALIFFRLASRLRLGMDLPINPVVSGDGVLGGHLLGDIALDTRVTMLDRRDGLGLSASARVSLPTGSSDAWVGAGGLTARALLGASTTIGMPGNPEALVLAANAGLATGSDALDPAFDLTWGMNLPFGVGASYAFAQPVWASAELSGAWVMGNSDQPGALPLEALLSLGLRPTDGDLLVTLGGGLPLSQGVGNPDLRGVFGVRWSPRPRDVRTWNLPTEATPAPAPRLEPIPEGMGRIAVTAQRIVDGKPAPVQATVVVLGTIADIDSRRYTIARKPRVEKCAGDGHLVMDLAPGEYTVRLAAEGMEPRTATVTVRAGHAMPLAVELEPTDDARFTAGAQGQVNLLPSWQEIPFRPESKALSTEGKDKLAQLSTWWARHLENTFVVITGYAADEELTEGELLHEQRAAAVKQAMTLPRGFTHCVTVRQGTCGTPEDPAACHKVTIDVTDLACPDLKPPGQ
jgi:hypothetical protein